MQGTTTYQRRFLNGRVLVKGPVSLLEKSRDETYTFYSVGTNYHLDPAFAHDHKV
jgi:hypothetical protein